MSRALQELRVTIQTWPNPRTTSHKSSPQNATEMASRNLHHKDKASPKRVNPQIPEEPAFRQEPQESPKEDAGNTEAESVSAEALKDLEKSWDGEAQDAKRLQMQTQPAGFCHSPQAWEANQRLHGQLPRALPTKV